MGCHHLGGVQLGKEGCSTDMRKIWMKEEKTKDDDKAAEDLGVDSDEMKGEKQLKVKNFVLKDVVSDNELVLY